MVAPPPKSSKTKLYSIIAVALVVVIVVVVVFVVLKKGGSSGPGGNSGVSLTTYTSSDGTFSVGYPNGWQKKAATDGTGVEFVGPADQEAFEVVNLGTSPIGPAELVSAACSAGTQATGPTSVTISGQQWSREECNSAGSAPAHLVAEAVTHNGQAFLIVYGSAQANFASDQSTYYTAMEQSFQFLK